MNSYNFVNSGINNIIGAPLGLPPHIPYSVHCVPVASGTLPPPEMPGQGLKRAINYLADYGGCSFYRCMSPNMLLNLYQKAVVIESTAMVLDPRFYQGISAIKIQRQATPIQKQFIAHLKKLSQEIGFKIIYEIDDIVFHEDIPMYNRNRDAFTTEEIRSSIIDIIEMCDEVTVTCGFMRDYFKSKTKNKNVTVIPNYLLQWWFDRYYNIKSLIKEYEKNRKKPAIAIFASGTHVDVVNRTNQRDDFTTVLPNIIKTRKEFNWKFYGSYPLPLKPFIDSGEITYNPWVPLPEFPRAVAESGAQLTFAALEDNNFNRAKSNIKLIESGAVGIPCVCPDMCTYQDALLKYKTGDEFIDQVKHALKDQTRYVDLCKKSRAYAETYWLESENNLGKHQEAYFTPYGSTERRFLRETNP